jgi:hypothetical protein
MLDQCTKLLKSGQEMSQAMYRESLKVFCPEWETRKRDEEFHKIIAAMEADIIDEMVKVRGCDKGTVRRYMNAAYRMCVLKADKFNLSLMSDTKRQLMAQLVESGLTYEEALKKAGEKKAQTEGEPARGLFLRPIQPGEKADEYLEYVHKAVEEFLIAHGLKRKTKKTVQA